MAFPGSPYRSATPTVRTRGTGAVFAIGRHVFVTCPSARTPGVTLTDDSGATPCGKLRDGAEVEIVAWRPRGSQGTRYLVRSPSKGVEGWLAAGELRGAKAKPPRP
jgi:hypothetical protein